MRVDARGIRLADGLPGSGAEAPPGRVSEPLFERAVGGYRFTGHHAVAHAVQLVDGLPQHAVDCRVRLDAPVLHRPQQGFELVTEIPHRGNTGHARAAFQGVQMALELLERGPAAVIGGPFAKGFVRRLQ